MRVSVNVPTSVSLPVSMSVSVSAKGRRRYLVVTYTGVYAGRGGLVLAQLDGSAARAVVVVTVLELRVGGHKHRRGQLIGGGGSEPFIVIPGLDIDIGLCFGVMVIVDINVVAFFLVVIVVIADTPVCVHVGYSHRWHHG